MSQTGLSAFDSTIQTTNVWLNEITERMGWREDKHRGYHALRAVLHALRDQLPVEHVAALGAQLPLLVRGIYYDGWHPAGKPLKDAKASRKVGLGVMGFAELLILLDIPYASDQAAALADELMRYLAEQAWETSHQLAHERGVFPTWDRSIFGAQGVRLRNLTQTSIAPTGTLSIIAGTTASIEPLFALAYRRHVLDGQTLVELNPLFLRHAQRQGFCSQRLVQELQVRRSLAGLSEIPERARELFRTALEIAPEDHLRIQAAFQKHVDNAVSKTVNLPETATVEDVGAIYRRAWELELKGVTVYRCGSRGDQVLQLGVGEMSEEREHFARCDPHACRL